MGGGQPAGQNIHSNQTQNQEQNCSSDNSLLESVCHSLYNIKIFRNEILDPKDSIENKKMSILLRQIFKNISVEDFSSYNNQMVELLNSYNFIIPQDPQTLIFQILTLLHLERKEQKPLGMTAGAQKINQYNAYDSQSALKFFVDTEIKDNKSFIGNIFRGVQKIQRQFMNSPGPMFSYSYFDVFQLYIPPIYTFLMRNYPNSINMHGEAQITLYQCLQIFTTVTSVVIDGRMVKEQTKIHSAPPCFIIALNRYYGGAFFSGKICYDDILDMSNYVSIKDKGVKYKLVGIIKQKGYYGNSNNLENRVRGVKPFNKNYFTLINEENGNISYFENNKKKNYQEKIDFGFYATVLIYYRV